MRGATPKRTRTSGISDRSLTRSLQEGVPASPGLGVTSFNGCCRPLCLFLCTSSGLTIGSGFD
ncbi:UNVERIFIED_CONTAM: hypothetical protein FKN15_043176 [Acipenser sinensis]